MKGHVKKLIEGKPFGFLIAEGKEYFFHSEQFNGHWMDLVEDFLRGGIEVEFDPGSGPKGLRANNVRRLDYPNQAT